MKVSVIFVHPHQGSFSRVIAETVTESPSERPWLKDVMKSAHGDGLPAMFHAAHRDAYFRTMENTIREHDVPRVKF